MTHNSPRWSADMDARLRALVDKGLSYSQAAVAISREFGMRLTRSAAVGRGYRIGITTPKRESCHEEFKGARIVKLRKSRAAAKKPAQSPLAAFLANAPSAPVVIETPASDVGRVSLIDLEPHHCRWPVTTDGKHLFCGESHVPGSSYCEHHLHRGTSTSPRISDADRQRRLQRFMLIKTNHMPVRFMHVADLRQLEPS